MKAPAPFNPMARISGWLTGARVLRPRKTVGTPVDSRRIRTPLPHALRIPCILACALLSACATAPEPAPDLEALHAERTAREGTPHYDHWSTDAQAEWETAFRRKHP